MFYHFEQYIEKYIAHSDTTIFPPWSHR